MQDLMDTKLSNLGLEAWLGFGVLLSYFITFVTSKGMYRKLEEENRDRRGSAEGAFWYLIGGPLSLLIVYLIAPVVKGAYNLMFYWWRDGEPLNGRRW